MVAFAAVLSLGSGLLFGMFPALQSTRSDLISSIRAGGAQASGARSAARFSGAAWRGPDFDQFANVMGST